MCPRTGSRSVPSAERAICIALHDVAPATWPLCERLLAMLAAVGDPPVTLLLVPDYHRHGRLDRDRAFCSAIERRLARGDEIALHGYFHLDEQPVRMPLDWARRRIYTAGEGEFAPLDADEARQRLERGLRLFEGLGWPVYGFVPPAWLMGPGTRTALAAAGLRYTTSLGRIYRLPSWQALPAPALTYSVRSGWRRRLSQAINTWRLRAAHGQGLLRIALHPVDAEHPQVLDQWQRLIARALGERRAMTKHRWLETH